MADKEFKIMFKTNLDELGKSQERLNKAFASNIKMLNVADGLNKSQLGHLYKQKKAWENVLDTEEMTSDEIASIDKNISQIDKTTSNMENPFESMLDAITPFGGLLISQNRRLLDLKNSMISVQRSGGFFNVMSDYVVGFSNNLKSVQMGMTAAFGGGMKGMLASFHIGLVALKPALLALMSSLAPLLPVILAIGGGVFILSRLWKNNVGGMQTMWYKLMGSIKDEWNKFIVGFDKGLRALTPLFKVIMAVGFIPIIGAVKLLGSIFKGLMSVLMPVFDAFSEIGKAMLEPFKEFTGVQGSKAINTFGILGKAIEILGKGLGVIVKISLTPLVFSFKILGKVLGAIVDGIKLMGDKLSFLKTVFEGLIAPFKFLLQGAEKIAKYLGMGKEETEEQVKATKELKIIRAQPVSSSQVINNQRTQTVNNNSNVVVNSSGAITKENAPHIGNVISSSLSTGGRL